MRLTRRNLILTGAGLLAAPRLLAEARLSIGDAEITSLSDGNLVLAPEFTFGPMPEEALADLLPSLGVDRSGPLTPPCNLTLYRRGDRLTIFDAGAGPQFMPSTGLLPEALDAAGIAPEEVTDVVFTHAHPDHLWGVLDDFDEPFFANAAHWMGAAEHAFWTDPATLDALPEDRKAFAVGAARRLEAVSGMIELFEDGDEVVPGAVALSTPGHTPGHMSFEIGTDAGAAVVIGDAVANSHVGLARPGWPSGSDQDRDRAAETRLRLLDRIASDGTAVVGFHFAGDGVGRIERDGEGYAFRPGV